LRLKGWGSPNSNEGTFTVVPASGSDNRGWGEHLGWRRSPLDVQRQQGRLKETDGGPSQRRGDGRAGKQENAAGIHRANPCARQKKGRGGWAAADVAAPTRPAATASLALWPAPALTAGARIRPLQHHPEGRWADARQCARRQSRYRPWAERAAQGRPARPLGPLVKVREQSTKLEPE
jgi:hypothetical protein